MCMCIYALDFLKLYLFVYFLARVSQTLLWLFLYFVTPTQIVFLEMIATVTDISSVDFAFSYDRNSGATCFRISHLYWILLFYRLGNLCKY